MTAITARRLPHRAAAAQLTVPMQKTIFLLLAAVSAPPLPAVADVAAGQAASAPGLMFTAAQDVDDNSSLFGAVPAIARAAPTLDPAR